MSDQFDYRKGRDHWWERHSIAATCRLCGETHIGRAQPGKQLGRFRFEWITAEEAAYAWADNHECRREVCCDGWGEVLDGARVVACPTCYPDAYEAAEGDA